MPPIFEGFILDRVIYGFVVSYRCYFVRFIIERVSSEGEPHPPKGEKCHSEGPTKAPHLMWNRIYVIRHVRSRH